MGSTSTTSGQTFAQALTSLVDSVYAEHLRCNQGPNFERFILTRDEVALTYSRQIRISADVMGNLKNDKFWEDERVTYGTFDNCREYGMTISINGWTFCVFEHRSSDDVSIEGCRTEAMQLFGPYSNDDRRYLATFKYGTDSHDIAEALAEIMEVAAAGDETLTWNILRSVGRGVEKAAA